LCLIYSTLKIKNIVKSHFGHAPTLIQVANFIHREKIKMGVNAPVSVQDLRKYVTDNAKNGAFIISGNIIEAEKFCIVWTTRKLTDNQLAAKNIHIDATYKILSSGFPMLVILHILYFLHFKNSIQRAGYTDANAKFFPTFAAIASSEDSWAYNCFFKSIGSEYSPQQLMADSAPQITKGL
jgi:ATP-dependent Zn protease